MKRIRVVSIVIVLLMQILASCTEEPDILPILDTIDVVDTDITSTSALLKGEFIRVGNQRIVEYGIELSKSIIFSSSQTGSYDTPAVAGVFQVPFTGLEPNTTYYYKAYAMINTAQVYAPGYKSFTTKSN